MRRAAVRRPRAEPRPPAPADRARLVTAYKLGATVARSACRSPRPTLAARGGRPGRGALSRAGRRAQVERNLRRVARPELPRRRAATRAVAATFESYARYWAESFRLPGTAARRCSTPDSHRRLASTSTTALGAGQGRDPRDAPPRRLGVGRLLAHRGAARSGHRRWSSRSSRRSCSSGSSDLRARPRHERRPARPGRRTRSIAGAAGQPRASACSATATSPAAGVEVEFFGERTTLPGGPATLALRTGAPLLPAAVYFRRSRTISVMVQRSDPRPTRRRAGSATTSPASPRTSPTSSRPDPRGARAVAPAAAQLAERSGLARAARRGLTSAWEYRCAVRIGLVCPYSLTIPGGVQGQVLGLARALRHAGHDAGCSAPVRRPAARCRGHAARASDPDGGQRLGGAHRARPVGPAAHRSGPLRDEGFDVVHLHEPLVPGPTHDRDRCSGTRPLVGTFHAAGESAGYRYLHAARCGGWRRGSTSACAVSPRPHGRWRSEALGGDYELLFNGVEVERFAKAAGATPTGRWPDHLLPRPPRAPEGPRRAARRRCRPARRRARLGRRRRTRRPRSCRRALRRRPAHRVARAHQRRGEGGADAGLPTSSARRRCGASRSAWCCSRPWRPDAGGRLAISTATATSPGRGATRCWSPPGDPRPCSGPRGARDPRAPGAGDLGEQRAEEFSMDNRRALRRAVRARRQPTRAASSLVDGATVRRARYRGRSTSRCGIDTLAAARGSAPRATFDLQGVLVRDGDLHRQ